MTENTTPLDFDAIKTKQQTVWSSGHYSRIGSLLQTTGESLAEAMDARPGADFLDVAAGNGNLTLAAARRYCRVVSTDYVESSLRDGEARARANGFEVEFRVADAEALPFEDASFDFVGSTFGVMFTPNQEAAARELLRVCKPGGRIGLANWTPEGFIGRMFRALGGFNPPPAGVASPARWGTEEFLREQLGPGASDLRIERRAFVFRFLSPEHFLSVFRSFYGPIHKAFEAQTEARRDELWQTLVELLTAENVATDGTLRIPAEYAEVVITTN